MEAISLNEFAQRTGGDAIYISIGGRAIRIPMTTDEQATPATFTIQAGQLEAYGSEQEAARAFATFILSAAVNALLPDEMRAKLARAAERL
jgi:hypothetical protein